MEGVDLNLLVALDVLLAEGSVTAAARRLGLSSSAMSRTLTRLRSTLDDPLLVRAGRGLVPTPRAAALRDRVHEVTRDVQMILRPAPRALDISSFDLTFTIRANESFTEFFAVPFLKAVAAKAPRVRLRFAPKPDKDPRPLREGSIDLEVGVIESSAPEMRTRLLFRDQLVGVARKGHPLFARREVSAKRFSACQHVVASPGAKSPRPVDDALAALGLRRDVVVVVPGFPDAMRIARHSDLVAVVPRSCLGNTIVGAHPAKTGLQEFALPVDTPKILVSAAWHPRVDADPAHRWLRDLLASLCRSAYPSS